MSVLFPAPEGPMSAHISPGCNVRSTIFRMRVPPAETPTLFALRGPGGRLVIEAIQDGSGYDCDGEALEAMSSLRKAKGCLPIYDVTETPTTAPITGVPRGRSQSVESG